MNSRNPRSNRQDSNFSRRSRDESYMRGDESPYEMNRYPHSYSEYDSHRDMENRRFGAPEGNAYLHDRSHENYSPSRELYRPSFDDTSRTTVSYSGRGPKGYKRSDERIREEVCEMLTRDRSIDAEDIEVDVREGEVILTGTVPDRRMKHLAEDCVELALGVKDVINNIRVRRDMSSSSDSDSTSLTGDRITVNRKSSSGSGSSTSSSNH